MKATTRVSPAILILAGLFLIKTYLYRLPVVEAFRGLELKSLADAGDDASTDVSTKVDQDVELASISALNDGRLQATATAQDTAPAFKTSVIHSPSSLDQIVVMGRTNSDDTSWVERLPEWRNAVYSVDNNTWPLHTNNKGREANFYLTYLIENYEELPSTIAFVHPHEDGYPRAWHTDADHYSTVKSLSSLETEFVQSNGYANLRCIAIPGCPDEIQPFREGPDEGDRRAEHAMVDAWKQIFGNEDVPKVIGTPCCAQFAVSQDQVHKRPLSFYVGALKWLHETPLDDATSGRVFEYIWHIIFGRDSVYCPDLSQCYHDNQDRCLLQLIMQAYRYEKASGAIQRRTMSIPEPSADQVLITVQAAGLCHSDLHILHGGLEGLGAFSVRPPLTLGHEVAGIISRLGPGVTTFQIGDRVSVAQIGYPVKETSWDTAVGLGCDGGLAEYVIAHVRHLVHVPAKVPLHIAAVATDAVSTAYHAVVTEAEAGPGKNIAIVGLGGLGLNGVVSASLQGANVYGFDIDTKRFEAAKECGAIACHQSLDDVEDGFFDAVVDFAGVGKTTALAIKRVKVCGVVVLIGLGVNEATLPTSLLTMKSIHLKGSMGASLEEYKRILAHIEAGEIVPVTEEISFNEVSGGLDRLAAGNVSGRLWTNPSAIKT
ncbi:hypothetical protein E4T48_08593 [Aureobasidium sp. EXF-10727]|nr:hypothetical protein E4T48_08593 [Aureobasidium sp. EXF-10727]